MKKILFGFAVGIFLVMPLNAQRYGQLETDILYAHQRYEKALVSGDIENLRDLYATEYIRTTGTGEIVEKEQLLEEFASGRLKIERLRHDYERTRGYGDTGIVNIIWTLSGKDQGKPFTSTSRVSIFYVKRENAWRIVAEHITPIKVQPDPPGLEETLFELERAAWEAWKTRDARFFDSYVVGDADAAGDPTRKAAVFKDMSCTVKSFSLENFKLKVLGDDKAAINYTARQDAVCQGKPAPPVIVAATLFVKRGQIWQATFHDESPAK